MIAIDVIRDKGSNSGGFCVEWEIGDADKLIWGI